MANNLRLDVTIEGAKDLLKLRHFLDPKLLEKATRGGIKYATSAAKVAIAKEVTARYSLKSARVKQDVGTPRFSGDGTSATIAVSRKPITGLSYGARAVSSGVSLAIFRGPRSIEPTAFMQTTGGRRLMPFRATSKRRYRGDADRPKPRRGLDLVVGPSIGAIFAGDSRFGPELRAEVQARINEQFIKGMQRVLDSAARGYGK
jgi:hypothetical protein